MKRLERDHVGETMKALVVEGIKQFTYQDVPMPVLKDDEALVRVRACGICGSDVPRVLSDGAHGYPIIVGHEFSGQVIAVGKAVKDVTVGARATVAPLVPCGVCDACAAGHPAMCTH